MELFDLKESDHGLFTWDIPKMFPYCEGHFPGRPIVPAVSIVDASLDGIRRLMNRPVRLSQLKSAKFMEPIVPEMSASLRFVKVGELDWKVEWVSNGKTTAELTLSISVG